MFGGFGSYKASMDMNMSSFGQSIEYNIPKFAGRKQFESLEEYGLELIKTSGELTIMHVMNRHCVFEDNVCTICGNNKEAIEKFLLVGNENDDIRKEIDVKLLLIEESFEIITEELTNIKKVQSELKELIINNLKPESKN